MKERYQRTRAIVSIAAGLFALAALPATQAQATTDTESPIHHVSSEVCANCHQDVYKQWKQSMHSQSTALADPIHGTFYKKVAGEPTEEGVVLKSSGKYPVCLQCHAPNAAIDKTTKLDAMAAYSEGVNCVACHTLKTYNGIRTDDGKLRLGLKAYEISNEIQAPAGINNGLAKLAAASDDLFGGAGVGDDSQKPNPHLGEAVEIEGLSIPALPMQANPRLMKTSDACMGCHDQRNNAHGVPLCQTGNEYMTTGSEVSCLSCHMPVSGGIADHTMGGGHNHDILKRSVVFDVDTESAGDLIKTTVFMKNQQPHAMPTGAPFRNIYVKLTAYDESGNPVWQNSDDHPAKGDPQAYLAYALKDDEGMPAPPPTATKPGDDTRLKPHEERTLAYEIPAEGVVLVRGELYYNLLWPGLVEKFSHLPTEVTDPVLIAESEEVILVE